MSEHLHEPSGHAAGADGEALRAAARALACAPIAAYVAAASGERAMRYASPGVERLTGRDAASLLERPLLSPEAIPEEDRAPLERRLAELALERPVSHEHRLLCADGETIWVRHEAHLVDAGEAGLELVGSMVDITREKRLAAELARSERLLEGSTREKEAERALRESEERFRSIVEGHPLPVWLVDLETAEILYESPASAQLMGREWPSDRQSYSSDHLVDPELREPLNARLRETGELRDVECEFKKADGTAFWGSINDRLISYGGREASISSIVDLTERKQREAELREAREALEDAIEALPEGFALWNADDRLVLCNTRFREFNAASAEVLEPGVTWVDFIRAGVAADQYLAPADSVDGWVRRRREAGWLEFQQSDGRWFHAFTRPTRQGGMTLLRIDITERKEMELALRESEETFRSIVEGHPLPVWMIDNDTAEILYASPAAARLMGHDWPDSVPRYTTDHMANVAEREPYNARLRECREIRDHEMQFRKADGTLFWASLDERLVSYQGREVSITSFVDLTERKRIEQALREREALVRRVLEACPVPVTTARARDGLILYRSPATEALFGEVGAERAETTLAYYADARDRDAYVAALHADGAVDDFEMLLRRRNGETFWATTSARLIELNGEEVIVSSTEDLTERLALEEEMSRQREALHQSEKMSAMGELLAGVSHELNNPLSVVVGQSLLLQETLDDPDALERSAMIADAAERCARIVRTFLAMARQQPAQMAPVDLNAVVDAALEVTGYALRSAGIEIATRLAPRLPPVDGDESQLGQVLTNLVVNAQHALEDHDGERRVIVASHADAAHGEVVVEVRDTGPGIPAEIQARIFEPFFTTKAEGVGTGIGLALCHRIVTSHEGRLEVETPPGGGTVMRVALPRAEVQDAATTTSAEGERRSRPLAVLVVDDEPDVAKVLAGILEIDGHETEIAGSGREALERIAAREFDLILSDLRMPNLDGPSLFRALARRDRALVERVAFVTGDTVSPKAQSFLASAGRPCLEKPVTPTMLRALIEEFR